MLRKKGRDEKPFTSRFSIVEAKIPTLPSVLMTAWCDAFRSS